MKRLPTPFFRFESHAAAARATWREDEDPAVAIRYLDPDAQRLPYLTAKAA